MLTVTDVVLESLLLLWTYLTLCFSVSAGNFEHVIDSWVKFYHHFEIKKKAKKNLQFS